MLDNFWIGWKLIFICKFADHVASSQVHENAAICGINFKTPPDPLRSKVLKSDESKTLIAVGEHADLWILPNQSLPLQPIRCHLELTACAVCQIRISWDLSDLGLLTEKTVGTADEEGQILAESKPGWDSMSECREDSITKEPCVKLVVEEDEAGALLQGSGPYSQYNLLQNLAKQNFTSSAFKLKIKLDLLWPTLQQEMYIKRLFPIKIDVLDNTVIRRGRPATAELSSFHFSTGYIQSPRYPDAYPDAVRINYTLINEAGGPVRLIFSDFQLHYMSRLKIMDNGVELLNTQGQFGSAEGRPAAVQSAGDRLEILFAANHYTQLVGFRAKYEFVENSYWPEEPEDKSCDKLYEIAGDSITIPGNALSINQYIDCVWIIGKSRYGSPLYNKLYVKVEDLNLQTNSKGIHLEIRSGRASVDRPVMDVWGPKTTEELAGLQPQEGFVVDLSDNDSRPKGFYIRLRGYLASYSGLVITFSQYYRWATAMCHDSSNEFHCDNGRCIKSGLKCDQKDHCGDFSDEKGCRKGPGSDPYGRNTNIKMGDKSKSLAVGGYTSIILLVSGLIGLTLVMLMVTVIVARIYRQRLIRRFSREARAAVAVRNQHSPRSDIADVGGRGSGPSIQRVGERRFFVMPDNDVQMFEAPPAYDDALKHPSVPPSTRHSVSSENDLGASTSSRRSGEAAFDNPGFSDDSEANIPPPSYQMPAIRESRNEPSGGSRRPTMSSEGHSDTETRDQNLSREDLSSTVLSRNSDTEDCASVSEQTNKPEERRGSLPSTRTGPLSGIIQWAKGKVTGGRNNEPNIQQESTTSTEICEDSASIKSGDNRVPEVIGNEDVSEKDGSETPENEIQVQIIGDSRSLPTDGNKEETPASTNEAESENSESAL